MSTKPFDDSKLQRRKSPEPTPAKVPPSVSAGSIDRLVDLVGNPSRDKMREVTIIDPQQGKLLPQLDVEAMMWRYLLEVAFFRQSPEEYRQEFQKPRPTPPDLLDEFSYRTAQWQKSVAGTNLTALMDLALAETNNTGDDGDYGQLDPFKES